MNQGQNSNANKSSSYNSIENPLASEKEKQYDNYYTDISKQISYESFSNSINENEEKNINDIKLNNPNQSIINGSEDDDISGKYKKLIFFIDTEQTQIKNVNKVFNRFYMNLPKNILYNSLFDLKKFIYHNFHFLGNLLGVKCTGCEHLTSSHVRREQVEGSWKCLDCKENDNICVLNDTDIMEIISYFNAGMKTYIKYSDQINNEA